MEDPPILANSEDWDSSFVEFIKYCLVKDPKLRPSAEEIFKYNKKFFSFCKDKIYLRENFLKGIRSIDKKVSFVKKIFFS